jgi:hypothetical protein
MRTALPFLLAALIVLAFVVAAVTGTAKDIGAVEFWSGAVVVTVLLFWGQFNLRRSGR